jgi:predicted GNAT family N-acyltransferase
MIIMPRMPSFRVEVVHWHARHGELHTVRRRVFIEEQGVPEALEWDHADPQCWHVLASAPDGTPIGTGRLTPEGRIGRMAVLEPWRRRGVGAAILEALLALARHRGCTRVRLHAQTHALAFYARFGFEATGAEFEEAGIPHRAMELALETGSPVSG